MIPSVPGVGQVVAVGGLPRNTANGGKSGLHRIRRQVIPGGREPTESAAESKPPKHFVSARRHGDGKGERVR